MYPVVIVGNNVPGTVPVPTLFRRNALYTPNIHPPPPQYTWPRTRLGNMELDRSTYLQLHKDARRKEVAKEGGKRIIQWRKRKKIGTGNK